MNTPICDFVTAYADGAPIRFHMPGHKGTGALDVENRDITEIPGADDLFHPTGIIARSEANASMLFGWPTVYSTEGSSLCIRAMLYLAYTGNGCRGAVLAGRNAHKSFLSGAVLLDIPIRWLWAGDDYLSCPLTAHDVENAIRREEERPCAVYLTTPDYLGNVVDVAAISEVCRSFGIPLLVDNAHGAYLKFLQPSRHPMDFGADFCCDSAHKTLPVLTGGAYLHFREEHLAQRVKDAMALFGSTSPSYLILQSLDRCNPYMETLPQRLEAFSIHVDALKVRLAAHGFTLVGNEKMKLTLLASDYGYTGEDLGMILERQNIICEFRDERHIVFMLTPENTREQLLQLEHALLDIPRRQPLTYRPGKCAEPEQILSPRQAAFARKQTIPVEKSEGRILASVSVGCPPAVPIVMCGERITRELIALLRYYGTEYVTVVESYREGEERQYGSVQKN